MTNKVVKQNMQLLGQLSLSFQSELMIN